jgi:hypothetical protein
VAEKIPRYEESDLPGRHKAALRLVDRFVTWPAQIDDALVAASRAHFSDEELVEVTLDVISWSQQKIYVALDVDEVVDEHGLAPLAFDEQGRVTIG